MITLWTPDVLKIYDALDGQMRLVGGCVRDIVVGRKPQDIDMATPIPVADVVDLLVRAGIDVQTVSAEYGVAKACINNKKYEITTLREDIVRDKGAVMARQAGSYEDDVWRRDFTMNALSMDRAGEIYDYVGGLADLKNKIVRFIGTPAERIREDAIRIYRYIRFWSDYGGDNPDENITSICKDQAKRMTTTSKMRRRQETTKIIMGARPVQALRWLNDIGAIQYAMQSDISIDNLKTLLDINKNASLAERLVALGSDLIESKQTGGYDDYF